MISYDALLKQLEQHVMQAKNAATEQEMREQLSAVRALCEVVLTTDSKPQVPTQIAMGTAQLPTQSTPLRENDANGHSIFDF